jgi:NDP-sugar pyrophosphorylase family protein
MKAIILAAGKGTRMRELTQDLPKPMLKVRGKPILEHIIDGLKTAGIGEFCVITGYRADVIENHFGNGARLGIHMSYARQEIQDGTGKAPELARSFIGSDDFLLTYGDILVMPETYQQMLARFRQGQLQGAVRGDRARAGVARQPLGRTDSAISHSDRFDSAIEVG